MFDKLKKSIVRLPTTKAWLETLLLWLMFAAIAFPVALHYQFVTSPISIRAWLPMALLAFFIPSLFEEIIWRGLLTPAPGSRFFWPLGIVSLAGFVVSHPVSAYVFRPTARDIFYSPAFLCLSTLLGFMCLITYARSKSLWPSIVIHWITVAVWLLFGARVLLET
jgi:uncharacterized protein